MRLKGLMLTTFLFIVLVVGGMASGQCDPDEHNNEATAVGLNHRDSITDWVCPDDLWDFYSFDVADGSGISGMITLAAEQSGTTIRITDPNGEFLVPRTGTSDRQRTLWIPIDEGALFEGTYYIRVGFWSAASYDHQYTLSMDLSGGTECVPDGNEDPETASELPFRTTVSDWVCADDHLDIWHFTVAGGDEYKGTISMIANPGELILYLYDSEHTELFHVRSEEGEVQYNLGSNGLTLTPGDYYLGVFLPLARMDENSYSLILQKPLVYKPADIQGQIEIFDPQPWTVASCTADSNNSEDTALNIRFDQKFTGWVCEEDPRDYFTFDVPAGAKLKGNINLSSPRQLTIFSVYNSSTGEKYLESKFTTEDELEFSVVFRAGDLVPGTYFISVTRMSSTAFDHQYTIEMDFAGYESEVTWARMYLDSFYCEEESMVDEGSSDDEPYFKIIPRFVNVDPLSGGPHWYEGSPQIFSDVDSGENRRFTTSQRKFFEGEVLDNPRWVHFNIELWEDDSASGDDHEDTLTVLVDFDSLFGLSYVKTEPQANAWVKGFDGRVASVTATLWSRNTFPTENKYHLRWHIEFDQFASITHTGKKFTSWDGFAAGKFFAGAQKTYVIAIDEDAPDNFGRFYFYNALGGKVKQFDGGFDKFDRLAAGDMDGDGIDEVVIASKQEGGYVIFYDTYTEDSQYCFNIPFTAYDGLAVADVTGDGVCEVLMAKDDNDTVYIYDSKGTKLHEFKLSWDFKGVRNTDSNTRHDAFLIGDVGRDDTPEIVMIENKNGESSEVHVYDPFYNPSAVHLVWPTLSDFQFTHYDAACLGDITGDDKQELLIAIDPGDGYDGCQIHMYDLAKGKRNGVRFWPVFQKFDGFAAGDVLGPELGHGKDQILLVSQSDDTVCISM